jgi:hypothetical protein
LAPSLTKKAPNNQELGQDSRRRLTAARRAWFNSKLATERAGRASTAGWQQHDQQRPQGQKGQRPGLLKKLMVSLLKHKAYPVVNEQLSIDLSGKVKTFSIQ